MSHAMKGALLSGLVCPGLGQIVLKRYGRGLVLMLTTLAALGVMVVKAAQQAVTLLDMMEAGGGVTQRAMVDAAQTAAASEGLAVNLSLLVIVICWLYGTIDAYHIGRQRDLGLSR